MSEAWRRLEMGAGRWVGEETVVLPDSGEPCAAVGHSDARLVFGGRGLAVDYRQEIDGTTVLTAHALYHWDDDAERFVLDFTEAPGATPTRMTGVPDGDDGIVFEDGAMRQTTRWSPDGFTVETIISPPGADPITGFSGSYRRAPAPAGTFAWHDLTVEDAPAIRDFWAAVVGWSASEVSMGEYSDYNMNAPDGTAVGGVCHARGSNAGLPPVWMGYVSVTDVEASVAAARERGGTVLGDGIREMGPWRMAVITDPAGATLTVAEGG